MNPFTARSKVSILNNISLNVQRNTEISLKKELEKYKTPIQVEHQINEKDENESLSSRSSQSESSDVVKLNGASSITSSKISKLRNTTLESKPMVALFIGDLDKEVTEDILRNEFIKFKSLVSVKICLDSKTGKSLGYGYLNFLMKEDADMATEEFNYRPIMGKEVRIMPSLRNTFYRKNIGTNVFFSNLPLENSSLTTRVFYDTFKKYGRILSCKLDCRKNIGFVYFESDQAARNVIENYNNKEFYGNRILCGVHFDKDLRKFPDFEKRRTNLESITIPKEELVTSDTDKTVVEHDSSQQVPHPNAIFVTNVPVHSTNEEILNFFSQVGPVKSVFSSKVLKYNSLWAFVTYKKGSDTGKAIEFYNGIEFKGKALKVVKAEPRESKQATFENYKTIVYFENASSVCNEEFLTQLCIQERIKASKSQITSYQKTSMTYSGFVRCKTKNDAKRLFESLNQRLIGGCVVKCLWMKPGESNDSTVLSTQSHNNSEFGTFQQLQHHQQLQHQHIHQHSNQQQQTQMLLLPFCQPLVYPNHSLPTQIDSVNQYMNMDRPPYKSEQQEKQVLDYLTRQVKKGIDFLKYPSATRMENLACITDYIFDVYWRRDVNALTKFLLLMSSNTQNEGALQRQIEEAVKFLGFGR